jgi:hypothetical protein
MFPGLLVASWDYVNASVPGTQAEYRLVVSDLFFEDVAQETKCSQP